MGLNVIEMGSAGVSPEVLKDLSQADRSLQLRKLHLAQGLRDV